MEGLRRGQPVKKIRLALVLGFVLGLASMASAQSVDAYFGFNALMAAHTPNLPYLGGGTYLNVGGDLIWWHGLGIGAEATFRARQALYITPPSATGQQGFEAPVRPVLYDFNAVWEPASAPWVTPFIEAGIGVASFEADAVLLDDGGSERADLVVVGVGFYEIATHPRSIVSWQNALFENYGNPLMMVVASLLVFPRLALGLSGF